MCRKVARRNEMNEVDVDKFLQKTLVKNDVLQRDTAGRQSVLVSDDEFDAMQEARSFCAIVKMREELAKARESICM